MTDVTTTVAAVDLGASSGRVMAGRVSGDGVTLHEVHRFPNEPVAAAGTLYWDILRLYADVRHGLLAGGLPLDTVARRMGTSERTVRRRVKGICDRLGFGSSIQAVAWAARRGLV